MECSTVLQNALWLPAVRTIGSTRSKGRFAPPLRVPQTLPEPRRNPFNPEFRDALEMPRFETRVTMVDGLGCNDTGAEDGRRTGER